MFSFNSFNTVSMFRAILHAGISVSPFWMHFHSFADVSLTVKWIVCAPIPVGAPAIPSFPTTAANALWSSSCAFFHIFHLLHWSLCIYLLGLWVVAFWGMCLLAVCFSHILPLYSCFGHAYLHLPSFLSLLSKGFALHAHVGFGRTVHNLLRMFSGQYSCCLGSNPGITHFHIHLLHRFWASSPFCRILGIELGLYVLWVSGFGGYLCIWFLFLLCHCMW